MTLTIIGAGPGGYETATAAAAKGIEVNIISDGPVGGTCLNEGCIPTKSLCRNAEVIEDMRKASAFGVSFEGQTGENPEVKFDMAKAVERKDEVLAQLRGGIEFLLKNKLIHLHIGKASFVDDHTVKVTSPEGEETTVVSDYIMIATGSVSASLPIPGNDAEGVLTSREILSLKEVPKRLCVIGAGVIGLEFASIFRSFGSGVTVLEYCKDILPRFDTDMAKRLKQSLGKRGIAIETSAQVQSISRNGEELTVKYIKKDKEVEVVADKVLMAVGRRPNIASLNLSEIGLEFTPKGIVTDANMRTNIPHIFAIGDIRGGMMLAHVATFEGERALNTIVAEMAGENVECPMNDGIDLDIVPAAVFTSPEAAVVGKTEDECKAEGIPARCLKSFFRANGKALSMDEPDGYCKIVVAGEGGQFKPGQILGCHMFGAHSADIVQEIAALMNMQATVEELRTIIHAHPTLSEVLLTAARQA